MSEFYAVICDVDGDVSYGLDYSCYSCGIFTSESEAEKFRDFLEEEFKSDRKTASAKYGEGALFTEPDDLKFTVIKLNPPGSKFVCIGEAMYLE